MLLCVSTVLQLYDQFEIAQESSYYSVPYRQLWEDSFNFIVRVNLFVSSKSSLNGYIKIYYVG